MLATPLFKPKFAYVQDPTCGCTCRIGYWAGRQKLSRRTRFELSEPPVAVSTRRTLRRSYVLHARGAGMSGITDHSQPIHTPRPLAARGWGTRLNVRSALIREQRIRQVSNWR